MDPWQPSTAGCNCHRLAGCCCACQVVDWACVIVPGVAPGGGTAASNPHHPLAKSPPRLVPCRGRPSEWS
jgi:hypothetical protein